MPRNQHPVGTIKCGDWVVTCSAEDVIWLGKAKSIHEKTNEVTIAYYEAKSGGYVSNDGGEPWVEHVASLSVVEPMWFEYCSSKKHFKCSCNLRDYINVPVDTNKKRKRAKKGSKKGRKTQKHTQKKTPRIDVEAFSANTTSSKSPLDSANSRRSSRRQPKPPDPVLQVLHLVMQLKCRCCESVMLVQKSHQKKNRNCHKIL